MKLFSLILRMFVLVACVVLIFGGQAIAHDDDEGELEDLQDETGTQDSIDNVENMNETGTVEVY